MGIDINKLKSKEMVKQEIKEVDFILEQEEILYTISESFIKYRQENNMTQGDLAKKLKVNQSMISKLESGNYNPTFKIIHKLTRTLSNSTEMFIKILENMIKNIKKVTDIDYSIKIEENSQYENYYLSSKERKNNVICLWEYKLKGDNKDERSQCKISVAR